jgi:hypothetical protein
MYTYKVARHRQFRQATHKPAQPGSTTNRRQTTTQIQTSNKKGNQTKQPNRTPMKPALVQSIHKQPNRQEPNQQGDQGSNQILGEPHITSTSGTSVPRYTTDQ